MDLFGDEEKKAKDSGPITGYSFKVIAPDMKNINMLKKVSLVFILIISIFGIFTGMFFGFNFIKRKFDAKKIAKENKKIEMEKTKEEANQITINENLNQKTKFERIPDFDKKMKKIIEGKDKEVYIVFAGGPKKTKTKEALKILKEKDIKANYFFLGKNIESNKEDIKKIYDEKHYISVTGYNEEYINIYESAESVSKSVKDSKTKLEQTIKGDFKTYTALLPGPILVSSYDGIKDEAKKILNKDGIDIVQFNQYVDGETPADDLNGILDEKISSNANVVLLIYESDSQNLKVFENILDKFINAKYTFKTFNDFFESEKNKQNESELKDIFEEKDKQHENETEEITTELN